MFIRVKTISGKKYAYLCESVWRESKNQQVVKQYLGKIFDAGQTDAVNSVGELSKDTLLTNLLVKTLHDGGFVRLDVLWSKEIDGQNISINEQTLAVKSEKGKDVIVKLNDGYVCSHMLLELHRILQEPSTDQGQELARVLVDTGFRIAPELFISIYTKLYHNQAKKADNP